MVSQRPISQRAHGLSLSQHRSFGRTRTGPPRQGPRAPAPANAGGQVSSRPPAPRVPAEPSAGQAHRLRRAWHGLGEPVPPSPERYLASVPGRSCCDRPSRPLPGAPARQAAPASWTPRSCWPPAPSPHCPWPCHRRRCPGGRRRSPARPAPRAPALPAGSTPPSRPAPPQRPQLPGPAPARPREGTRDRRSEERPARGHVTGGGSRGRRAGQRQRAGAPGPGLRVPCWPRSPARRPALHGEERKHSPAKLYVQLKTF